MKLKGLVQLLLCLSLLVVPAYYSYSSAKRQGKEERSDQMSLALKNSGPAAREIMLGGLLKGALENLHITKMPVDNSLSEKAMKEFIKRLDYGKQFFLQSDIKDFEKYRYEIDDQLESGSLVLMDLASSRLEQRQKEVFAFIKERLKQPFDFNKSSFFETDSEKREFIGSKKELEYFWEQLLQYEILSEFAELKEQQAEQAKVKITAKKDSKDQNKKGNKEQKDDLKNLTDAQLEAKSIAEVLTNYEKVFTRLEKDRSRDNQLDKFYNAIATVYDPHTYYLIPDQKDGFDIDISGKLEGIGALLKEEGNYIKIEDVIPGSPSWKSKQLEKDDLILKVGQEQDAPVDVTNMRVQDAVKLIRGKKGSTVVLTVRKPDGLEKPVTLVRDVIELEESYLKGVTMVLPSGNKIGYLSLPKFYRDFNDRQGRNCSDDMKKALAELSKQKVVGLVLDLRDNGGGALVDAAIMTGLFIDKGPVVQVKAHTGAVEVLDDKDSGIQFDKPLVVLVNNNSASASEIVAAALQDYKRAVVVGTQHTHGKGTVQQVIDLDSILPPMAKQFSPMGALKITIQKFYRINGSSTQYKGVTPDIILPDPMTVLEKGERFLDYSLPWSEVKGLTYQPVANALSATQLQSLKTASGQRILQSPAFKKIEESIQWYEKRNRDTKKEITKTAIVADRALVKEMAAKFDVTGKLASDQTTDKKEKKQKEATAALNAFRNGFKMTALYKTTKEGDQDRFKRFSEGLELDPYVTESAYIVEDMLGAATTKKTL